MEKHCVQFKGKNDDFSKSYGHWFQNDVLGDNYCKPQGKRFGLEPSHNWSMKAPMYVEEVDSTNNYEWGVQAQQRKLRWWLWRSNSDELRGEHEDDSINDTINFPNLNVVVTFKEMMIEPMAIIPFQPTPTNQELRGLTLFGFNLNALPAGSGEHIPVHSSIVTVGGR